MTETKIKDDLIPVTQWESKENYPSTAGLRWLIFNEKQNGFDKVVRRIGRRVLISRSAFYEWVESQNGGNAA